VQKHIEHVYVKLGVETRTAAVMRAGVAPVAAPDHPCRELASDCLGASFR